MTKEDQLGILKMVALDFNDGTYSNRICYNSDDDNLTIEITRDFIVKTVKTYTAQDIINMSLNNDGNVCSAIIKNLTDIGNQQIFARYI